MARLFRPVMKTMSRIPAATASSTAYWMRGLSTIGIISLGLALVAGRKRLPIPATGKTALVTFFTRQKSDQRDRKSTRLNSSHTVISYAVFCLKKKKKQTLTRRFRKRARQHSFNAHDHVSLAV